MKFAASALTALIVASTAGAAFANTDAAYVTETVPASAVYASPENHGITGNVTLTSGTTVQKSAALLNVSDRQDRDLALADNITVTAFPRADVPFLASSGR
ncbi:hypothetical protein KM176_17985 [Pseudooceanicola sp. CBS1P-1]|uniref:HlyD family efflux transporter periplasmic adaptor subunit n=1 Tax=Pseudooceanicola albus TaxID=2692189 RepID=A0A6L7G8Z4_9RHOB|nr:MULTISPECIES: hypothetical protein [Pseudooceanicola]MBT9385766.1 hypothetical protein [Pseudooceanicola endophyticus]MXN19998.1 hypothetical protein [Pseudooceanicola albus]